MASVVVTVGMGRWPFDRLVRAAGELSVRHRVFVQSGTSTVSLPSSCEHHRWVEPEELERRMLDADVVVTHAGNTVRWLQRRRRVPVAVARQAAMGEMGNDHQVRFLRIEERHGPVIGVWDVGDLADVVDRHDELSRPLSVRPVPDTADPVVLRGQLDRLAASFPDGPFAEHPVRRYDFAWRNLIGRSGAHLDLGCNTGELLSALCSGTRLDAVGVDSNREVLDTARAAGLPVLRIDRWGRLPFPDATFSSATALDVLEHVPDERVVLEELRRVMRPDGLLIATVPAAHALSVLDPDNVKLRFPRLHGAVYRARFGAERYRRRFVDLDDGYRGDLAVERADHTNFPPAAFLDLLSETGFEPVQRSGANLLWQLWHPAALLGGRRLRAVLDRMTLFDGRVFDSANLFVVGTAR